MGPPPNHTGHVLAPSSPVSSCCKVQQLAPPQHRRSRAPGGSQSRASWGLCCRDPENNIRPDTSWAVSPSQDAAGEEGQAHTLGTCHHQYGCLGPEQEEKQGSFHRWCCGSDCRVSERSQLSTWEVVMSGPSGPGLPGERGSAAQHLPWPSGTWGPQSCGLGKPPLRPQ